MSWWENFKKIIGTEDGHIPLFYFIKNKLHEIVLYENKNVAYKSFEKNLMIIKAVLLLMLIIMSIYYPLKFKSTGIIKTKPWLLFFESIVFGLCTIVPFIMLVLLRNNKYNAKDIFKFCILLFIIFFIINYLLELSGFYEYSFSKPEPTIKPVCEQNYTDTEKMLQSLDFSLRVIFYLVIGVVILMIFIAIFFIHDSDLQYNKFKGKKRWFVFFIESLLFGAMSAVPIYFIAKNRESLDPKKTSGEFLIITFKFMLINMALQFSGFYNHFFRKGFKYKICACE